MLRDDGLPVIQSERAFDISELFFSTTDRKGIITTCNEVFLRVAGFPPDELLGKPHNTIRHPEMPRCVFELLWEYILSGRPIGAYVKNRAKTGEYYWVYALASPAADGFISVRLKPITPYFDTVRKLYPDLLAVERSYSNWKEGMAASRVKLLAALSSLGFESYTDFMNVTLRAEIMAREAAMAETIDRGTAQAPSPTLDALREMFRQLDSLLSLKSSLRDKEKFFKSLAVHISRVAINASVQAAHLAERGRALSVIGEAVSDISREIERDSSILRTRAADLAQGLGDVSFHIAQAILQSQAKQFFELEQRTNEMDIAAQSARFGGEVLAIGQLLERCSSESLERAAQGITALRTLLKEFDDIASSLENILLSIQFSYVTGKTLTARIDAADGFAALLSDMVSLSDSARKEIMGLKASVREVRTDIGRWNSIPAAHATT